MGDPRDKLRHQFPADLLVLSGLPLLWAALLSSLLFALAPAWKCALAVAAMSVGLTGGVAMTIAKWPLYRRRRWWTLGDAGSGEGGKRLYRWGLRLAVAGLLVAAVVVLLLWLPA